MTTLKNRVREKHFWPFQAERSLGTPFHSPAERTSHPSASMTFFLATCSGPQLDGSILMFANSERGQIRIRLAELHPRADVFEVLVPPLVLLHVSSKVRVHNAHAGVMEFKPYGNTTFVTLKDKDKRRWPEASTHR